MTKMTPELETKREELENAMAAIAAARKHLEIIELRITNASQRGMSALLVPALDEIIVVARKLNRAQKHLSRIHSTDLWRS